MTQFVLEKRVTKTAKAIGHPTAEEIAELKAKGYQYDGRSRQWYISDSSADLADGSQLATAA